ncbi:UNVERIFIED_CONTAM: hypothetical protein FKN15_008067 [Acipenser sinensis]
MPERKVFIKTVIIDCLGVPPEMILCLQRNGTENYVDVTMVGETSFKEFLQQCKEKEDDAPLSNFKVESLSRNNFRVVTVHMYNPHVTDSTVGLFLCRSVRNHNKGTDCLATSPEIPLVTPPLVASPITYPRICD